MFSLGDNFGRRLKLGIASTITLVSLLAGLTSSVEAQDNVARIAVAGSNEQWHIEGTERSGDARITDFLGRESLWLRNNTHVIRTGVEFVDGTIEFNVAPMDRGNFVGILFRRASFQNQENIYLRIHRSGLYNAVQYAPRVNGSSTWQLYPEFNAVADLPRNQWTHVRVEVRGPKVEVYLNNQSQPTLIVPRLRGLTQKGSVAFWGRVNDQPTMWAAALSNISIRPLTPVTPPPSNGPSPPANTLSSWEVSGPVQAEKGRVLTLPQLKDWRPAEVEEAGLVSLNRALGNVRGRWTGFARTKIVSEQAKTAVLELGYSDDVTVFLNGEPVYSGINGFESRHPEYMGFVKPHFESVHLKLRSGANEIILAVTDDQRFGWGFNARLRD